MTIKEEILRRVREDERRRLAGELHDRVLQVLSHVALSLEVSRKHLLESPEKVGTDLSESEEEIRSSIAEIRRIIYDSRVTWTPGSLTSKLLEEIRKIESRSTLKVSFQPAPVEGPLPGHIEEQAFFAVREAIINIDRHAKATGATVAMKVKQDALMVSVSDNGAGFAAEAERYSGEGGYGLKNIERRIQELGGRFTVESQPGGGTRVLFEVPLRGAVGRPMRPRELPRWRGSRGPWPHSFRWLAGATILLVLLVIATFAFREKTRVAAVRVSGAGLFDDAVEHYERVSRGAGDLARARTSPFELLDLSSWGYRILSRKTREVNGRETRVFMYQGEKNNDLLVAEELDAVSLVPPDGARWVRARGRELVSYSKADVNTVAWLEEGILCVLVSRMPESKLLSLAQEIGSRSRASQ